MLAEHKVVIDHMHNEPHVLSNQKKPGYPAENPDFYSAFSAGYPVACNIDIPLICDRISLLI